MLNSHVDKRLTKSGGMPFDIWAYILGVEMKAHDDPVGQIDPNDWQDFYDDDRTPHDALEEDFNAGQ